MAENKPIDKPDLTIRVMNNYGHVVEHTHYGFGTASQVSYDPATGQVLIIEGCKVADEVYIDPQDRLRPPVGPIADIGNQPGN